MSPAADSRADATPPAGLTPGWLKGFAVGLALLLLAAAASQAASRLIIERFADRPSPRDLLLSALPYSPLAQYVADGAVLLAVALVAIIYFLRAPKEVPRGMAMFGTLYLLRAGIIVLTPLASPHGRTEYGFMPPQFGMFPSGHAANVLLCCLLAEKDLAPRLRYLVFGLAAIEWSALLLSRGHYSIDIIGGMLLAYFVWRESTAEWFAGPWQRLVSG